MPTCLPHRHSLNSKRHEVEPQILIVVMAAHQINRLVRHNSVLGREEVDNNTINDSAFITPCESERVRVERYQPDRKQCDRHQPERGEVDKG